MTILQAFDLTNKVALVTGGNRGLGQAIALGLAEAGAHIASLSRSEESNDTQKAIEQLGKQYRHITCDLETATVDTLSSIIQQVQTELGRLDILVNNAGIIRRAAALEHSEADWDAVLQVNLKAVFFLSQSAAQIMKQQGSGKIIHIASMLSYQGGILVPSYTAAKSALAGLTRAQANEWAAHNIQVNAIAPGYMATDNTAPLRADEKRNQAILERIPIGRWGDPSDLKGAAVFLASAASDYVNGTLLAVDGGWLGR